MTEKLLRLPGVVAVSGLSKASVYRLEKAGHFPKRVQISPGSVGWRESDILAWIAAIPTPASNNTPS